MKILVIWMVVNIPTSPLQIDKVVLGFSSLADCGAVQSAVRIQHQQKRPHPSIQRWQNFLIYGDLYGTGIYYEPCK